MSNDFDIDLDGITSLELEFEDLKEDGSSDATHEVFADAEYSGFLEFGTEKMPPYPFFRPAIREARLDAEILLRRQQQLGLDDFETTDELVLAFAESLKEQMQNNVRAQLSSGVRSPGTAPTHPQVQSGNLLNSIKRKRL